MRRLLIISLALALLAVPAAADAGSRLSVGKVRAEAAEIGDDFVAHRRQTGVTGYFIAGCKRRNARRVLCRLMLLNESAGGQMSCQLPVLGVRKKGRTKILLGTGDCI